MKWGAVETSVPLIPDHELIRLIGRGSSGDVWLGRNVLGGYRAIKVVYEKNFRSRRPFEREFKGIQKFEPISRLHDGLVDVLQVGRNPGAGYFYCVMELADDVAAGQEINPDTYTARTLAHDVARYHSLPIGECIRLTIDIAQALAFVHKQGLIHRDVKPSNIVFVHGLPKLADIGLVAELSEARSYVGTDGFIPPEGPGTVQADIYSLGKVLYEISTGKDRHDFPELPPYIGDEQNWDLIQLNKVILKACRSDLNDRFRTAIEMIAALRAVQLGKQPVRIFTPVRIIKGIGVVGALVAVTVVSILIWRLIQYFSQGL
jgi:serine/threonine protein kinase